MGKKNKKKSKQTLSTTTIPPENVESSVQTLVPQANPEPTPNFTGLSLLEMKLQSASVAIDASSVVLDLNSERDPEKKLKQVTNLPKFFRSSPTELSFSYNLLGGSVADCIIGDGGSYWEKMVMLNVAENELTSLSGIEAMPALERLNARYACLRIRT